MSASPAASQNAISIWYQVDGRGAVELENFSGENISELRKEIHQEEKNLDCAPSELQLFVVHPETEEEINLVDLRKELIGQGKSFGFEELVDEYNLGEDNPIIVRLLGTLLVLLFLSWL